MAAYTIVYEGSNGRKQAHPDDLAYDERYDAWTYTPKDVDGALRVIPRESVCYVDVPRDRVDDDRRGRFTP